MIKIKGKPYTQGAEAGFQPQAISQDVKVVPKFLNQVLIRLFTADALPHDSVLSILSIRFICFNN